MLGDDSSDADESAVAAAAESLLSLRGRVQHEEKDQPDASDPTAVGRRSRRRTGAGIVGGDDDEMTQKDAEDQLLAMATSGLAGEGSSDEGVGLMISSTDTERASTRHPLQDVEEAGISLATARMESNWRRQDYLDPPSLSDAEKWRFVPGILVTDAAPAAGVAVKQAFNESYDPVAGASAAALVEAAQDERSDDEDMGETEIKDPITLHLVICMAHARIWMNKHKPLLVVSDELEGKAATAAKVILFKNMTDDFQKVQSACLSVALNRPAFKLLIDYWKTDRGQNEFADSFDASWGDKFNARVQVCASTQGGAGVPNHNNGPEGHNAADKFFFKFERPSVLPHLVRMRDRITDKSWNDNVFGDGINREVWNGTFFLTVHKYLSRQVCPLDIVWKISFKEEFGQTTREVEGFMFPSVRTVTEVTNQPQYKADAPKSVKAVLARKGTASNGTDSWQKTFQHLLKSPEAAIRGEKTGGVPWNFKLLMDWMTSFRVLIEVKQQSEIDRIVGRWQRGACVEGNYTPAVVNTQNVAKYGIMRCKCAEYLLREFCLHVAAYNIKHKIMEYPLSYDPRSTSSRRGRPPKATSGGALRRE